MKVRTMSWYKKKLWGDFGKYMRTKIGKCQRCDKDESTLFAHHVVPKAKGMAVYFEEKNIIILCYYCHSMWWHGKATIEECKELAISLMGEEVYWEMHRLGNTFRKYTIPELMELRIEYKEKLRTLE